MLVTKNCQTLSKTDIQTLDNTSALLMANNTCLPCNNDSNEILTNHQDDDDTLTTPTPLEASGKEEDVAGVVLEGATNANNQSDIDYHTADYDVENQQGTAVVDEVDVPSTSTTDAPCAPANESLQQAPGTMKRVIQAVKNSRKESSVKWKNAIIGDDLTETSVAFEDGESPAEGVWVPLPGQVMNESTDNNTDEDDKNNNNNTVSTRSRQVLNGCTICLTRIVAEEKITWSSNPQCLHVFHHDCVMNWFLAVGRKETRRRQQQQASSEWDQICTFPTLCPCCRQSFILLPTADKASDKDKTATTTDVASSSSTESDESQGTSSINSAISTLNQHQERHEQEQEEVTTSDATPESHPVPEQLDVNLPSTNASIIEGENP
jgi:hypothetical protein